VSINHGHARFVEEQGIYVVELDKALCGCVEAEALWYAKLSATLMWNNLTNISYDPCVFNKVGRDGIRITVAMYAC